MMRNRAVSIPLNLSNIQLLKRQTALRSQRVGCLLA